MDRGIIDAGIRRRMDICLRGLTENEKKDLEETVEKLMKVIKDVSGRPHCQRMEIMELVFNTLEEMKHEILQSRDFNHPCGWGNGIYCPQKVPSVSLKREKFMPTILYYI